MFASQIGGSEFQFQLYFQLQLLANVPSGRLRILPPTQETWMEFPARDFSLAQPQLLWTFAEVKQQTGGS